MPIEFTNTSLFVRFIPSDDHQRIVLNTRIAVNKKAVTPTLSQDRTVDFPSQKAIATVDVFNTHWRFVSFVSTNLF